jgi:hypothetical protein
MSYKETPMVSDLHMPDMDGINMVPDGEVPETDMKPSGIPTFYSKLCHNHLPKR